MDKIWSSVLAERLSLGAHYDEKLRAALGNLWRCRILILITVAVALVLGILGALLLPKRYAAEAYVRGGFALPDAVTAGRNSGGAFVTYDASLLVETRSRLLQSHQMARQVLDRLGPEQLRSEIAEGLISSAFRLLFSGAMTPRYENDIAAERLLRGLRVKTEPRVYLITVRYTASDPELAARIANAFVAELGQTIALQMLSAQRTSLQDTLLENLATFGGKHPNVKMAMARLAALDTLVEAQKRKTLTEMEWIASENVTLAQAVAVPSTPNPAFCIGLALLLGLAGGIAVAILAPDAPLAAFNRFRRDESERFGESKWRSRSRVT